MIDDYKMQCYNRLFENFLEGHCNTQEFVHMVHIPNRIGIDIGKVIIDGEKNDKTDTSFFGENFLQTSAVPEAFQAIALLVKKFGAEHVFLISKCGVKVQEKTLAWLENRQFFEQTGLDRNNLRFCRNRSDKAGICKGLGITHFVDDRAEILVSMQGIVMHRYVFNPGEKEFDRHKHLLNGEQIVRSWPELVPLIFTTLR